MPQMPSDAINTASHHKVYHYRLKCTAAFLCMQKHKLQYNYTTCNSCNMDTRDLPDMYA